MTDCEKVSVCCGAAEGDAEGFCAQCRDGTGWECSIHEREWYECKQKEANTILANAGLRHAQREADDAVHS